MRSRYAFLGLTLAYACWSLENVTGSLAKFGPAAVTWISGITFIVLIIKCNISNIRLSFEESKKAIWHSLPRVLGLSGFFIAALYLKVGVVDTIVACNIFFIIGVLAPHAGEKVNNKIILPLMTSIFGVALICGFGSIKFSSLLDPHLLIAIATMFVFGFSVFNFRKCSRGIDTMQYLTYMHGWVFAISLPAVFIFRSMSIMNVSIMPNANQSMFLMIALLIGLAGDAFFAIAQSESGYTVNAILAPLGAAFSCLFGWLLKGDTFNGIQVVGLLIVVTSISITSYINSLPKPEKVKLGRTNRVKVPAVINSASG